MTIVRGILGQSAPAAATDDDLYTVPDGKSATVKVIAGNRAGDSTIRVWVGVDGAASANEQYLVYDKGISANDSLVTSSFMVGGQDVVRVRSASGSVSFSVSGIEE